MQTLDEAFHEGAADTLDIEKRERERRALMQDRERYEAQLDADYKWLMDSFAGRRLMWDLIAPMWRSSYVGTREDTDFREGERNVALRVWARLVRVCPALARKMMEENPQ